MTNENSNREVKSSAFTTFFSVPENAAKLYQALDQVEVLPEEITFTTLSGVLFMARKNDMAFTVGNKVLVISEHQSTINDNMPLRASIYYGRTMEKLIEPRALYRSSRIPIPTPEFFVFYNGNKEFPPEKTLMRPVPGGPGAKGTKPGSGHGFLTGNCWRKQSRPYSPDRSPSNTSFVSTGITFRWCLT